MVRSFSGHLDHSLARLPIPAEQRNEIQSNYVKLAALEIPPGLDRNTASEIKASVNDAFVYGFRWIMLICAGLSVVSAAQARWLIPGKPSTRPDLQQQPRQGSSML
jgi:hypothetical protein